ncbi:MAG: hypothetical protein R2876_05545 [Eubacteriales bacterium]
MEISRCMRRIIELKGKSGEKGILKLIDQPEGMQCQLITEIPDNKTLYLKNSAGVVCLNIKDSYMLTNSSADDIKSVAVVCRESICLTGGENLDWNSIIIKPPKEEPDKKAFKLDEAKEFTKKEEQKEKLKTEAKKEKLVNNDMLLNMLPHLLKNGEQGNQDMSKLFSMMQMLNGNNNMDTGMLEKMMALMSNDSSKNHTEETVIDEAVKDNNIPNTVGKETLKKEDNKINAEKKLSEGNFDEAKSNGGKLSEENLSVEQEDIKDNGEKNKEADEGKENKGLNQESGNENKNKEKAEILEELEEADYCDLNMFEWNKVDYPFPQTGHYISGSAIINGLKAYATGIPGEFSFKPPPWQGEFTRFFNYLGQGYWVKVVMQKGNG